MGLWNKLKSLFVKQPIFIVENEIFKPYKKYPEDAGWDLRATESVTIPPHEGRIIDTGVMVIIPKGYYGKISDRSSVACKRGLYSMAGVIDSSYRGKIKVLLYNSTNEPITIEPRERIAQLVIHKINTKAKIIVDKNLKKYQNTKRADKGFGSTGRY